MIKIELVMYKLSVKTSRERLDISTLFKGLGAGKNIVADSLAEWLRRWPAKPMCSHARVRISQASSFFMISFP